MEPEVALVTAGVEYDVLGIGMAPRPETTFGTVNAGVLERYVPGYRRDNFVDIILNSDWPE